jgi:hypothetical protein
VKCDCPLCDGAEYVDEVGLMVVEEAIRTYVSALQEQQRRIDDAFAEANAVMDRELKGGH